MVYFFAPLITRLITLGVPRTLAKQYARIQRNKSLRKFKRKYKRRPRYFKSFEFGVGYAGGTNIGYNTINQSLFGNFPRAAARRNYL